MQTSSIARLSIALLLIAPIASEALATSANAANNAPNTITTLEVVGEDFPDLLVITPINDREEALETSAKFKQVQAQVAAEESTEDSAEATKAVTPTPAQVAEACARVRAKRLDELEGGWAQAVERIVVECDYQPNELGDGLVTSAHATLKPGRVRMFGLPVAEVRIASSDWGGDSQYVLDGNFGLRGKALINKIATHCRAIGQRMSCEINNDGMHGGYVIHTGEIGSTWLHPDEDNIGHMIYAEAWSE